MVGMLKDSFNSEDLSNGTHGCMRIMSQIMIVDLCQIILLLDDSCERGHMTLRGQLPCGSITLHGKKNSLCPPSYRSVDNHACHCPLI